MTLVDPSTGEVITQITPEDARELTGQLNDEAAVQKLGNVNGGVNGLLGQAERLRLKTGNPKGQCVAAAAVEIINQGRGGAKLESWWK